MHLIFCVNDAVLIITVYCVCIYVIMSERGSVVDMDCVSVCLVGQVGTAV